MSVYNRDTKCHFETQTSTTMAAQQLSQTKKTKKLINFAPVHGKAATIIDDLCKRFYHTTLLSYNSNFFVVVCILQAYYKKMKHPGMRQFVQKCLFRNNFFKFELKLPFDLHLPFWMILLDYISEESFFQEQLDSILFILNNKQYTGQ